MNGELFILVQNAKNWLASRPEPQVLSPEWQTRNQLRLFIDLLEKDSSLASLEMAITNLRRYMVANSEWSTEYGSSVSRFCSQADQIRRKIRNTVAQSPVPAEQAASTAVL